MKVQILKQYKYSPDGNSIVTVEPGEQELEGRWANKAIQSGHGQEAKSRKPSSNKSKGNAPENK